MELTVLRRDEVGKLDENTKIHGVVFHNCLFTPAFLTEEWHNFEFAEENVLLVTYPKSGTNWVIDILSLIHCKGDPKWVQSEFIWIRSPWIEMEESFNHLKKNICSPFITSHLPIQFMPESFFRSKVKVIYIIRNPKDVIVSGYFFWKGVDYAQKAESMDQYIDWFMEGNVPYGLWFDHVHGWLSMRECDNFLLLSYEELKMDLRNTVKKISQFLGVELGAETIDSVLENCSFQAMKDNNMSNYSFIDDKILNVKVSPILRKGLYKARVQLSQELQYFFPLTNKAREHPSPNQPPHFFMEKMLVVGIHTLTQDGVTGDWKNHLTVAQAETFDKIYLEKMKDLPSELFLWS